MNKNAELKNDIIRLILELDDVNFLQKIKKIVIGRSVDYSDWANELNESQIQLIKLGEKQLENRLYATSAEVHKESKAFLEKKRREKND
jgi:hypothetical protein